MNVSDKLAVLMEFNGYTKDELEAYLSLKFGSMTKGGMTASILSQSGYEKAKSVIFGQPQLNKNQQQVLGWLKVGHCDGDSVFEALERITDVYEDPKTEEALESLSPDQEVQVISSFMKWTLEQEAE
jgi:hypothetical protein|nr:MAG TPA: hypothetical protein [Caudoviricetes sp.]